MRAPPALAGVSSAETRSLLSAAWFATVAEWLFARGAPAMYGICSLILFSFLWFKRLAHAPSVGVVFMAVLGLEMDLGDARLNKRARVMVEAFAAKPTANIPMGSSSRAGNALSCLI